jgi:hypothetical protein
VSDGSRVPPYADQMRRTERMSWGEQFIVAAVPRREIPDKKIRATKPQRSVSELPLFDTDTSEQLELEALGAKEGRLLE